MSSRNDKSLPQPRSKEHRRSRTHNRELEENAYAQLLNYQPMGFYPGISPSYVPDRNCYQNMNCQPRSLPWQWQPMAPWVHQSVSHSPGGPGHHFSCRIPGRMPAPFLSPQLPQQHGVIVEPMMNVLPSPRNWYSRIPGDIHLQELPSIIPGAPHDANCFRHNGGQVRHDHSCFVEKAAVQSCSVSAVCDSSASRRMWYKLPEKDPENEAAGNKDLSRGAADEQHSPNKIRKLDRTANTTLEQQCSNLKQPACSSSSNSIMTAITRHSGDECLHKRLLNDFTSRSVVSKTKNALESFQCGVVRETKQGNTQNFTFLGDRQLNKKILDQRKGFVRNSFATKKDGMSFDDVIELSDDTESSLSTVTEAEPEEGATGICNLVISNTFSLAVSGQPGKEFDVESVTAAQRSNNNLCHLTSSGTPVCELAQVHTDVQYCHPKGSAKSGSFIIKSYSSRSLKEEKKTNFASRSKRKKYEPRKRKVVDSAEESSCWSPDSINQLWEMDVINDEKMRGEISSGLELSTRSSNNQEDFCDLIDLVPAPSTLNGVSGLAEDMNKVDIEICKNSKLENEECCLHEVNQKSTSDSMNIQNLSNLNEKMEKGLLHPSLFTATVEDIQDLSTIQNLRSLSLDNLSSSKSTKIVSDIISRAENASSEERGEPSLLVVTTALSTDFSVLSQTSCINKLLATPPKVNMSSVRVQRETTTPTWVTIKNVGGCLDQFISEHAKNYTNMIEVDKSVSLLQNKSKSRHFTDGLVKLGANLDLLDSDLVNSNENKTGKYGKTTSAVPTNNLFKEEGKSVGGKFIEPFSLETNGTRVSVAPEIETIINRLHFSKDKRIKKLDRDVLTKLKRATSPDVQAEKESNDDSANKINTMLSEKVLDNIPGDETAKCLPAVEVTETNLPVISGAYYGQDETHNEIHVSSLTTLEELTEKKCVSEAPARCDDQMVAGVGKDVRENNDLCVTVQDTSKLESCTSSDATQPEFILIEDLHCDNLSSQLSANERSSGIGELSLDTSSFDGVHKRQDTEEVQGLNTKTGIQIPPRRNIRKKSSRSRRISKKRQQQKGKNKTVDSLWQSHDNVLKDQVSLNESVHNNQNVDSSDCPGSHADGSNVKVDLDSNLGNTHKSKENVLSSLLLEHADQKPVEFQNLPDGSENEDMNVKNKACQTDKKFTGCLTHALQGSCYHKKAPNYSSRISYKFVKFHEQKLLCIFINVKKYVIVRELVYRCFPGKFQKLFYRSKHRDYKIPYMEMPLYLKSFVMKYLMESNIVLNGNKATPIGILLLSDAELLYHFFFSFQNCQLISCVEDWNPNHGVSVDLDNVNHDGFVKESIKDQVTNEVILSGDSTSVKKNRYGEASHSLCLPPTECTKISEGPVSDSPSITLNLPIIFHHNSTQEMKKLKDSLNISSPDLNIAGQVTLTQSPDLSVNVERTHGARRSKVKLVRHLHPRLPLRRFNRSHSRTRLCIFCKNCHDEVPSKTNVERSVAKQEESVHSQSLGIVCGGVTVIGGKGIRFIESENCKHFILDDFCSLCPDLDMVDITKCIKIPTRLCTRQETEFLASLNTSLPQIKLDKTLLVDSKIFSVLKEFSDIAENPDSWDICENNAEGNPNEKRNSGNLLNGCISQVAEDAKEIQRKCSEPICKSGHSKQKLARSELEGESNFNHTSRNSEAHGQKLDMVTQSVGENTSCLKRQHAVLQHCVTSLMSQWKETEGESSEFYKECRRFEEVLKKVNSSYKNKRLKMEKMSDGVLALLSSKR